MQIDIPKFRDLTRDQTLSLINCRSFHQYLSMLECYLGGRCPFCDLHPSLNHVVRTSKSRLWQMWENPFAHEHTRLHLVMATVRHIGPTDSIIDLDFQSIGELFQWAQEEYQIPGGCLVMRFGSPELNAGSVLHLHANIIVPDGTGDVHVAINKDPERHAKNILRLYVFEKMRLGVAFEELQPDEKQLVEGRL